MNIQSFLRLLLRLLGFSIYFTFVDLKITHVRFWSRFSITPENFVPFLSFFFNFYLFLFCLEKPNQFGKEVKKDEQTRDAFINTFLVSWYCTVKLSALDERVTFLLSKMVLLLLSKNYFRNKFCVVWIGQAHFMHLSLEELLIEPKKK